MKYDTNKTPFALLPVEALDDIAKVFGHGAEKYGPYNWRKDLHETSFSRTYSSIQRHLNAFWQREDNDPESGFPHLAHAASQIMILMIQTKFGRNMDDRWSDAMYKLVEELESTPCNE